MIHNVRNRNHPIKNSALRRTLIVYALRNFLTLSCSSIPIAYPKGKGGGIDIKVISGKSHGVESPVRPLSGCWFLHVTMRKAGAAMFQDIRMYSLILQSSDLTLVNSCRLDGFRL